MDTIIELLNGWKKIAIYLGTSIRSAQRYERFAGLPIRRPTGRSKGAVWATKAELDAWVNANSLKDAFRLKPILPGNYRVAVVTFKSTMAEQRRLREEMTRLREEVHTSLELLRSSLAVVHNEFAGRLERQPTGALSGSKKIM
jgi:hypothetical protein